MTESPYTNAYILEIGINPRKQITKIPIIFFIIRKGITIWQVV